MNAISKPSLGAYTVIDHTYDVVVVGAGGAGLRATLGMGAAGRIAARRRDGGAFHHCGPRSPAGWMPTPE